MPISIRAATGDDVEALCDVYYAFHQFHVAGAPAHLRSLGDRGQWDRSPLVAALQAIFHSAGAQIFVAEASGALAGLVEVYVRDDPDEATLVQHRYAELQSLMVLPPFQRLGIGTRLVEAAQHWARAQGATEMRLSLWESNAAARGFYQALGFRTLKRSMVAELAAMEQFAVHGAPLQGED